MIVFKAGDKVKQSADSTFRYGTRSNPINVVGEVTSVRDQGHLKIQVQWPEGATNSYAERDLELVVESTTDLLAKAKELHDLRAKQAELTVQIEELAALVSKALEGTGLVFLEDVPKAAEPTTLLDLVVLDTVEKGQQFMCNVSDDTTEHVVGKVYTVIDLDRGDSMPVKLTSEDGYGWWLNTGFLKDYILVS